MPKKLFWTVMSVVGTIVVTVSEIVKATIEHKEMVEEVTKEVIDNLAKK